MSSTMTLETRLNRLEQIAKDKGGHCLHLPAILRERNEDGTPLPSKPAPDVPNTATCKCGRARLRFDIVYTDPQKPGVAPGR